MFMMLYAVFATIFAIGTILYFSWSREIATPEELEL